MGVCLQRHKGRAELTFMVEQYLDGPEVDVDVVLNSEGDVAYGNVTDNWPTIEPYFNETGGKIPHWQYPALGRAVMSGQSGRSGPCLVTDLAWQAMLGIPEWCHPSRQCSCVAGSNCPSILPMHQQRELCQLSVAAVKCMGFTVGVFHVECKYTSQNGPQLIEVTCADHTPLSCYKHVSMCL